MTQHQERFRRSPFVVDRQLILVDHVGALGWNYDVQRGALRFGEECEWRAEILGTESEENGIWLWAWANEGSDIPRELQAASMQLKVVLERLGIAELTVPIVPLAAADGQAFASLAVGEGLGQAYFRAPYPGGAAFLLITDERLQFQVDQPLQRIVSVFPQAISALELPDHREALRSYLLHYGFAANDEGEALTVRQNGHVVLRAEFDDLKRLQSLTATLQPGDDGGEAVPSSLHAPADDPPAGTSGCEAAAQARPGPTAPDHAQVRRGRARVEDDDKGVGSRSRKDPSMQQQADSRRDETETAFSFLAARLPASDLTTLARQGKIRPAVQPGAFAGEQGEPARDIFDAMARVLYRRDRRHLLITGQKGIGKTTLIWELARRAAQGQIRFLADRKFLWIDVSNVGPEDSRGCLETILQAAASEPNVVLCLDGIDALLKRPLGGTTDDLLPSPLGERGWG